MMMVAMGWTPKKNNRRFRVIVVGVWGIIGMVGRGEGGNKH
jgi:hypothetical protein